MLRKLQNYVTDENTYASYAAGSMWIFPRPLEPELHINNTSFWVWFERGFINKFLYNQIKGKLDFVKLELFFVKITQLNIILIYN